MKPDAIAMTDLPGMWRRSLIERADGSRDTDTLVRWLQGPTLFVDLRQPQPEPALPAVRALDDLEVTDCLRLATQEGFAGRLVLNGDCFEWRRSIDFQPPSGQADAGSLHWESGILVERGRDEHYTEHWHPDPTVVTRPLCALGLQSTGEPDAILLLVGTVFMFARARSGAVTPGLTLAQCVSGAGSVRQAREIVDCEISLGSVGPGRCLILASTLPHRVACDLGVRLTGSILSIQDAAPDGRPILRRWDIVQAEGDPAAWAGCRGN